MAPGRRQSGQLRAACAALRQCYGAVRTARRVLRASAVLTLRQPRRTSSCPRARSPPAADRPRTSSRATARRRRSFHDAPAARARGQKPGSKSPSHRGYRAAEEGASAAPKTRWTATQRAGRDEARGIRTHSQGDRPARSYDDRPAPLVRQRSPAALERRASGPSRVQQRPSGPFDTTIVRLARVRQ